MAKSSVPSCRALRLFSVIVCILGCAAAAADLSNAKRQQINLNGVWQAQASATRSATLPDGPWGEARVPHSWGRGEFENFPMPQLPDGQPALSMWFQREIDIPESWDDSRRILVKYLAIHEAHRIYWNGRLVCDEPAARYVEGVDVTPFVRHGEKNTLTVQTIYPERDVDGGGFVRDLGITRSIYLVTQPRAAIAYALVQPSVKDSRLAIRYGLRNGKTEAETLTLGATVLDREGNGVLELPSMEVTLAAGEEREVELSAPWPDPILWGFGEYGQPYLYTLRSKLGEEETRFDRFGFREFSTEGTSFLLNGKPIFLKGDLLSRYTVYFESPQAITAYYQRLKAGGMNFLRLHGSRFDSHCWYDVADELGFLVEAQATHYSDAVGEHAADSPTVKHMWRNYVIENYNHPALVFWSLDNETFSVGLASRQNLAKIKLDVLKSFDALSTYVRELDPTRIVEIHHNYMIYPFVKRGRFDRGNFQTFNIHPYGSLELRINAETKGVGFDFEVPVVVGEIFHFPNPRDFVNNPMGALADQWRVGNSFATQITEAARAKGVASIILCSLDDAGFVGFNENRELELGPWSEHAVVKDDAGSRIGKRNFRVKVKWPSLSGEGVRPMSIPGYAYDGGSFGYNFNWFDPSAPLYRANPVVKQVRDAFAQIPNGDVPAASLRAPEVIVLLPKGSAGAVVRIAHAEGDREVAALLADPDGRGWFRLNAPGAYRAEAMVNGKLESREFVIDSYPPLDDQAGYGYLTLVEFERGAAAALRAELSAPTEFLDKGTEIAGELAHNGDFENWDNDGQPSHWMNPAQRIPGRDGTGYAALKKGDIVSIAQSIQMQPGKRYRISGWIRKEAGKGAGVLALRTRDWQIKVEVPGTAETGKWQHVETEYTADGSEAYLYCTNNYMGEEGVCAFDDISVRALDDENETPGKQALMPGPFELSPEGFVRDWLVLGPLPNLGDMEKGFHGHMTDFLQGEKEAAPEFGDGVEVDFPEGSYWVSGTIEEKWSQLHSSGDFIDLTILKNPAIAIAALEPAYVSGYLYAVVESPMDQEVQIGIGSDDGYKLWLNGELIGEYMEYRGAEADQERYTAPLRQGENRLLLKVSQATGGWGAMVRLRHADGTPLPGIRILLKGRK